MSVVLLALAAAVSYGMADFIGGAAAKRTSAWAVVLVAQTAGALATLGLAVVVGGSPAGADYAWACAAGVCNGIGTAFLYRGLSTGRMGVVAPVSGVGAATVPVLVGLAMAERPGILVWVGILIALPGIWLVSRQPPSDADLGRPSGLTDGIVAGLGFGSLFACLAQIPEGAGFLPLALNQVVAAFAVLLVAVAVRAEWVPREPAAALGVIGGILAAAATGLFLVASQTGFLTVAAVITSLYPAITVILAAVVLREAVHRGQVWGLGLCLLAIGLVAGG